MRQKVVPIVFATDDNYAYICSVAIYSVIKHVSDEYRYEINVMHTGLSDDKRKFIESFGRQGAQVRCVDITDFLKNIDLPLPVGYPMESYYRLVIPYVFPEYDKVIYLDCDICLMVDIAQLYETDLCGYTIGVALDVQSGFIIKHTADIGDYDYKKMFNSGVMLIDTLKYKSQNILDKCVKLINERNGGEYQKLMLPDQDALNIIFYDNYYQLDRKWNYIPYYCIDQTDLAQDFREEYRKCRDRAVLFHYAGGKPWEYPESEDYMYKVYWECALESGAILPMMTSHIKELSELKDDYKKSFGYFHFPYGKVDYDSRIVLYGAGNAGKSFYLQNRHTAYADIVGWVDKNAAAMNGAAVTGAEVEVTPVETIKSMDYDYVVIAIEDPIIASSVSDTLQDMGIPKNKIVWNNYKKKRRKRRKTGTI